MHSASDYPTTTERRKTQRPSLMPHDPQQRSIRMNTPQRMEATAATMQHNGTASLRPFPQQPMEYGIVPVQQPHRVAVRMAGRNAREERSMFVQQQQQQQQQRSVNGAPFLHADPTLPARYHPYPQVPTELHSNYAPNFSSRSAKEGGYGIDNGGSGGGGAAGVLYGMESLGHQRQQLPADFVIPQTEQWGYVANGTEGRLPGRGSLGGSERPPFPSQPSYSPPSFMNTASNHARTPASSGRLQHQQIYSNGSTNYLNTQAMPAPTRTEHAMRSGSGIEGFFASSCPDQAQMLHPVQHMEGKPRPSSYSNKHANWPTQQTTTRHGGMISHGVPAPYDPGYPEYIGGIRPPHRQDYDMPRTMMPSQQQIPPQQRTRAVPGNPYDCGPMAGIRPGAVYARDDGSMMHARMERVQRRFPTPEEELCKKCISPYYHELEESYAFCSKAYEVHKNRAAGECAVNIRKTIQAIKELFFSSRHPWPPQEKVQDMIVRLQKKMCSLIRAAKQIKAQLESPQSINSTANASLEEQEDIPCLAETVSRIPSRQRISHTIVAGHQRMALPISNSKPHLKERELRAGNLGNRDEVIVLDNADDADDARRQKEHLQKQIASSNASTTAFQLQPRLGNDPLPHPGIKTQQPSPNPAHHDVRRKRELVLPDGGHTTDIATSPRSRDIRRRLNPAVAAVMPNRVQQKIQVPDVHPTAANGREHRGDVTPPFECAASNDDNNSVEGDIPRLAEIDSLLAQLDGFQQRVGSSDEALCDLILDEDDASIYDRRFLETLASTEPSRHSPSRIRESIPQMAFKPSHPLPTQTLLSEPMKASPSSQEMNEMDMDHDSLYAVIQEECADLQQELNLPQPFRIMVSEGTEGIAVEYEASKNKDGDDDGDNVVVDTEKSIKLIVSRSYPSTAPIISFTHLYDSKRLAFIRNHFLRKIMDMQLVSLKDILRVWLVDICTDDLT